MNYDADGGDAKAPAVDGQLEDLRELLVGPQRQELQRLSARLDALSFAASEVGRVLPEAITLQNREPDAPLSQALVPVVEGALISSVRKDRERIADLLYPVMGPAIRKSIAEALTGMVQSLNQALEHSLSVRGLLWRIEALRTGVSFAEVLLRHNLLYRVEQVFLIHRQTGLPIQHLVAKEVVAQDSSLVSGMLTALRDFVRDSFTSPQGDGLDMLKVGDLNVWIEQGPSAILAAVIRGSAPESLRTTLRSTLENLHVRYGERLAAFDGDDSALADARPLLQPCMTAQYKPQRARPSGVLILLVLLALVGSGYLVRSWWQREAQWESYVSRLRAEHGIVLQWVGRRGGRYQVQGLRDPLARDPWQLLAQSGIQRSQVDMTWEEYQAMYPEFLEARDRAMLAPPAGVSLSVRGRTLLARGRAPHRWLVESRRLAALIPGLQGYADGEVEDSDLLSFTQAQSEIERTELTFPVLSTTLAPELDGQLDGLAQQVQRLLSAALRLGSLVQVRILGQADVRGTSVQNLALSQKRADAVAEALRARNIPAAILLPVGVGVAQRPGSPTVPRENAADRRVAFRIERFNPVPATDAEP